MSPLDQERYAAIALTLLGCYLVARLASRSATKSDTVAAAALTAGALAWLAMHNAYEGPSVVGVGTHGIALADLGVPMWLAVGVATLLRR